MTSSFWAKLCGQKGPLSSVVMHKTQEVTYKPARPPTLTQCEICKQKCSPEEIDRTMLNVIFTLYNYTCIWTVLLNDPNIRYCMHTADPAVISPLSSQKNAVFLQKSDKERLWWVPQGANVS